MTRNGTELRIKARRSIIILIVLVSLFACTCQVTAQTSRRDIPFNTDWQFKKGAENYGESVAFVAEEWEDIQLPHTYNRTDMQLDKNFYTGDGFYRKVFTLDESLKDKRVFLHFEGVSSVATVYINGRYLTRHKGAYSAFAFEITNSIKWGEQNTLLIRTNNEAREDVIPINQFLFPLYGGIYRPVRMIITNKINISTTDYASPGIFISQHNVSDKSADIRVDAKLENKEQDERILTLQTTVSDAEGRIIQTAKKKVLISPQGTTNAQQEFQVKRPHLWQGVEDPYLYKLTTSLIDGNTEIDAVTQPLGIRSFELRAGEGMFLNGKKYPMYGVTRHQDIWKYGSALSFEQHKTDMEMIREIGATTIRLAHYQQAEDIYSLADSMGFLIWAEIPFVNNSSGFEGDNAKQQILELVRQNRNHPSIYIWGLHNEVYSRTPDDHVPVLTRQLNDIAKTNDPYRLTAAVSGYGEMNRPANMAADVQGMNRYYGWYEGKIGDLEQWVEELAQNYPGYRVILAEYGADGNMDQSAEFLPETRNPVSGTFFPENYQTETHIQQWAIIEKHPYIVASYLWNMFEFAVPMWNRGGVNARNLKGLVTFDRKRKKDSFYWYKANWNPEPMLYLANRRDKERTKANTQVQVFSNLDHVQLTVNGKSVEGKLGVNDKHWIFDVQLKPGENIITATAESSSGSLSDKMEWILQ